MLKINTDHGIPNNMLSRHGLITGATGTGKSSTVAKLMQQASEAGLSVIVADVKGDLAGISRHVPETNITQPAGQEPGWPEFGAKLSDMGPMLVSRLLGLNETQRAALHILFKVEPEIYTLQELSDVLWYVHHEPSSVSDYGMIAPSTASTIMRKLIYLREGFFTAWGITPLQWKNGKINVISAEELVKEPRMYATLMLWILETLYTRLDEVGQIDNPLILFIDEAHLLFQDATKEAVLRIELIMKLIRSKGVSVWFITQSPADIPDGILSQLGTRIQHALRAYTPKERRSLKASADSLRPNESFDTIEVLPQLEVGEVLFSTLDEGGAPTKVERVRVDYVELRPVSPPKPRIKIELTKAVEMKPSWFDKLRSGFK